MAIYIIQYVCPQRHCIIATAYDPEEMPHDVALATMQSTIEKMVAEKLINPWCGICDSRDLRYEPARKTKYATKEEAKEEMSKLELEQMVSRALIDQQKANRN